MDGHGAAQASRQRIFARVSGSSPKLRGISLNSEIERRLEASFEPTLRRDEFMGYVRRLAKQDEARDKAETSLGTQHRCSEA